MLQLSIIGNLGADAQVKDFNGRKAVTFNVAHTDRWSDESGTKHEQTTWVSCILNGDGGNLLQFLKAGTTVYAIGAVSTRVYSSPKERKMVAGLNLRIDHIELVGGRVDEVPRQLMDEQGLLYNTTKCYWLSPELVKQLNIKKGTHAVLTDVRMTRQFSIDNRGYITPMFAENYQGNITPMAESTSEGETAQS